MARTMLLDEPQPGASLSPLEPPEWISASAKEIWRATVGELWDIGVFRDLDSMAFACYCQAYARWKEMEQFLDANGMTTPTTTVNRHGVERTLTATRPEVGISRSLYQTVRNYQHEFGLTPSARSGIKADPPVGGRSELAKLADGR